uniref:Uncharacterized protein n=1 Tax=Arundo donax TaxID=35708 RepID=A0A0A8ZJP5_ARUDO
MKLNRKWRRCPPIFFI